MEDENRDYEPAVGGIALILQSDPSQAFLVESIAMEFRYEPLIISQARHIKAAQHSVRPALIVMDLYMDEFDGIEMTRALIASNSRADVIMTITGDAIAGRAAAAMADRAGLFRFLPVLSPIDADGLRAAFAVFAPDAGDNITFLSDSRLRG